MNATGDNGATRKTVRPEKKTKARPEAKAPDRQTNEVFSSSLTPQFGLEGREKPSARRPRVLIGLRPRETTVLKPEKSKCPKRWAERNKGHG